jgi:hypothetical protein
VRDDVDCQVGRSVLGFETLLLLPLSHRRTTMRLAPLLAFGLALLPASVRAEGEANATTFLALYDAALPEVKGRLRDHVEDVALGVAWANAALNFQKQKPLYCRTEKQNLTGEQAVEILRKEIEARPASGNFPWTAVLIRGLQHTFPCS